MELDAIILGLILYLLLVGIRKYQYPDMTATVAYIFFIIEAFITFSVIIINEAFCKTICMRNARRIAEYEDPPDVELNERRPSKPVTRAPKRNHGTGDAIPSRLSHL